MTDPTHSLLGNCHMAIPPPLASWKALAGQQLSLPSDILHFLQVGDHARLVEDRVGRAHAAAEVKFELLHGECLRNQV